MKVAQLCLTVWDYMDYIVHGILQAKSLEWVGISLNMWIALGSMAISTILILPIHKHVVSFHFFELSSVSFINVYSSCHIILSPLIFLVRFIPKYFILVGVILKSIVLLHFLTDISLLV